MTRAIIGAALMLAVGVAVAYGLGLVGVPKWISLTLTFAIGYTSAPHLTALLRGER